MNQTSKSLIPSSLIVVLTICLLGNSVSHAIANKIITFYDGTVVLSPDGSIRIENSEHPIQTLKAANVVDFDLLCNKAANQYIVTNFNNLYPHHIEKDFCYLVLALNNTIRNIELYAWRRTQFDLIDSKDSYGIPRSITIFQHDAGNIFVAVAQFSSFQLSNSIGGGFIGSPVFRIANNRLNYYQYIKGSRPPLPSDTSHVEYDAKSRFLRFNRDLRYTFSEADKLFWLFSEPSSSFGECMNKLDNILTSREILANKLLKEADRIQRIGSPDLNEPTKVVVKGNVIVRGELIDASNDVFIGNLPLHFDSHMRNAANLLAHVKQKLSKAVLADAEQQTIQSRVRFFGPIFSKQVIFRNDITNSDVKLNGIPFHHLERNLVSLRNSQVLGPKVIFKGQVFADTLELHALINDRYLLRDAVDILSRQTQVIDLASISSFIPNVNTTRSQIALEFASISTPALIMNSNSTFNFIKPSEFVTPKNGVQRIRGRKSFRSITTRELTLTSSNVFLNGYNISHIIDNSIKLYPRNKHYSSGRQQQIYAPVTFARPVNVNRLIVNNLINRSINMTSLIRDSVKTNEPGLQIITGFKHFLNGLHVDTLRTEGFINDVPVNDILSLNRNPSTNFVGNDSYSSPKIIRGDLNFLNVVNIIGDLEAPIINGVDIPRHAVRRFTQNDANFSSPIQIISGRKTFTQPLRVLKSVELVDNQKMRNLKIERSVDYPLINGIDVRRISDALEEQRTNPSTIFIETLEVEGNLNLATKYGNFTQGQISIGNITNCPIEEINKRLLHRGAEDQIISGNLKVDHIRARTVSVGPGGLNGLSVPEDFILRSLPTTLTNSDANYNNLGSLQTQHIFGPKTFENLVIVSPFEIHRNQISLSQNARYQDPLIQMQARSFPHNTVTFGPYSQINGVGVHEIQALINLEQNRSTSGQMRIKNLDVYGNIFAKRINGYRWPEDILLRNEQNIVRRRIYSNLVFGPGSRLVVNNHLTLKGPIQMNGLLNNVNLTNFMSQAVTLGDKDLLTGRRPLRNKEFAGGITVTQEIQSQGLIQGVDFDDLRRRVVTVDGQINGFQDIIITSPKIFMSDVRFMSSLGISMLNDIPLEPYLSKISRLYSVRPVDGQYKVEINNRKTVSGVCKFNRNLTVDGLINGINFVDLERQAISLSPGIDRLKFNKTVTIEGDVYANNLKLSPNSTIDGVLVGNLATVPSTTKQPLPYQIPVPVPNLAQQQPHHEQLVFSPIVGQQQYMQHLQQQQPQYPFIIHRYVQQPMPLPQALEQTSIPHNGISYLPQAPISSIMYESVEQNLPHVSTSPSRFHGSLNRLRDELIHFNVNRTLYYNIIVGFVEEPDIALGIRKPLSHNQHARSLMLDNNNRPALLYHREDSSHIANPFGALLQNFKSFDSVTLKFPHRRWELHVGVGPSARGGRNITSVWSTNQGETPRRLTVLPVEGPRAAIFVKSADLKALVLLVAQGTNAYHTNNGNSCPRYGAEYDIEPASLHVYQLIVRSNSSEPNSAYFELFQTVDLPPVDVMKRFSHGGSDYIVCLSREVGKVYLLIMRGYVGFQVVSYVDAPSAVDISVDFDTSVHDIEPLPRLILNDANKSTLTLRAITI